MVDVFDLSPSADGPSSFLLRFPASGLTVCLDFPLAAAPFAAFLPPRTATAPFASPADDAEGEAGKQGKKRPRDEPGLLPADSSAAAAGLGADKIENAAGTAERRPASDGAPGAAHRPLRAALPPSTAARSGPGVFRIGARHFLDAPLRVLPPLLDAARDADLVCVTNVTAMLGLPFLTEYTYVPALGRAPALRGTVVTDAVHLSSPQLL